MMRYRAIIFGCGLQGRYFFEKFNADFDIVAFSDNNQKIWGSELFGKPIIAPDEIELSDNMIVFVCVEFGFIDIAKQLESLKIPCIINRRGVCYKYSDTILHPVLFHNYSFYKRSDKKFSVLFVQEVICGRTDKISSVLKKRGIVTQNAFFIRSSQMRGAYDKENSFYSYDDLLSFVNGSDFDIIHCSNEPDLLATLLLHSNKPIVLDTHDLLTARKNDFACEVYHLEYIANKFADGNMYVGEYYRDLQVERYGISADKTFIIPNFPLESQLLKNEQRKQKLSVTDGELHIVYEGGISPNPGSHRFVEKLWDRITSLHIHIHYYSQQDIEYCKALEKKNSYLHYEGNLSGLELIIEMTQYDLGSLLLNPVDKNADMSYPNKLFEYLAAGLPIISNLTVPLNFVESNNLGGNLDLSANIKEQLQKYAAIQIPDNYLCENKLTMDTYANDILAFYKKIINRNKAVKR